MNFRQIHLDFHTSEHIREIGGKFDKKQFQEMLTIGHVNSITLFSKCHHGWAYHPSRYNEMHPGLSFDLLKEQIQAAHEIGIKTPVYISAGLDEKISRRHPEWLIRNKNESTVGAKDFYTVGYHRLCFNTGYLDYLLKQIEEVTANYAADGIFLDIAGVVSCYCQSCVSALLNEDKDPLNEEHVTELAERVYANYTARVEECIHAIKPEMKIFHNGGHITRGRRDLAYMNTHLELESLPTGGWGYDHFPLSARYAAQLGLDFLGMTGRFHTSWGEFGGYKHPNALRYETALSLANGAKCSIGDQLHPSGMMDKAAYTLIGQAYQEVEAREEYCDNVENVADIGILSQEAFSGNKSAHDFSGDIGAVRIMLEGKYLFDILDEDSDFAKYKLLILPDNIQLNTKTRDKLKRYMSGSGKILATGKSGLYDNGKKFALDFGIKFTGLSPFCPAYIKNGFRLKSIEHSSYVIYSNGYLVKNEKAEVLSYTQNSYFNRDLFHFCSHQHTPCDMTDAAPGITRYGNTIYIAYDMFSEYAKVGSITTKETLLYVIDLLLDGVKTLETNLPAQGIATLMNQKTNSRLICHLLYASPVRRGEKYEIIEDIIPIYDVRVKIKPEWPVKKIYSVPEKKTLEMRIENGMAVFTVKKLDCHVMVVLEYDN